MHQISEDYIVGLVDGEGSFTAYVRHLDESQEKVRRVRIEPRFYVKLVETDKAILYELKKFFGCGNVYLQRDQRKNHKHCYRYEVANRKDLETKILPFFRFHPLRLSSKKRDFGIFCKIMKGIALGKHLTENGLHELYMLKQDMH